MDLYKSILVSKNQGKKLFAILIDPDKQKNSDLLLIIKNANKSKVNYFFVGGSLLMNDNLNDCIMANMRRSLIYPLFRRFDIAVEVLNDVQKLLKNGKVNKIEVFAEDLVGNSTKLIDSLLF